MVGICLKWWCVQVKPCNSEPPFAALWDGTNHATSPLHFTETFCKPYGAVHMQDFHSNSWGWEGPWRWQNGPNVRAEKDLSH